VVAIRFTDEQYAVQERRAAANGESVGDYLKHLAIKPHHGITKNGRKY